MQRRLEDFGDVCRRSGLKSTHQRAEIYRELAQTLEHPDAETIYARVRQRLPSISLDTVYRTLRLLEEKGVVGRAGTIKERARFDANTDRHHHFVCRQCGLIRDFYSDTLDRLAPPREAAAFGHADEVHVEIRGVCAACRSGKKK